MRITTTRNFRLRIGINQQAAAAPFRPVQESKKLAVLGGAVGLGLLFVYRSYQIIEPGEGGVRVIMSSVTDEPLRNGVAFKTPFGSIETISVRQQSNALKGLDCFSSDKQQVTIDVDVIWQIEPDAVVKIYRDFRGDPFTQLVSPRVQSALKDLTVHYTAEAIGQKREEIKKKALVNAQDSLRGIIKLQDIVLSRIALSPSLEAAVEKKMVREQDAKKARFVQEQTAIEARTATIKALGEAGAIAVQGLAAKSAPNLLNLKIAEKWDGQLPQVIGDEKGPEVLFPLPRQVVGEASGKTLEEIRREIDVLKTRYLDAIDAELKKIEADRKK